MAVDLREIVAAIRVSGDLERVGDLAKNIAKRTLKSRRRAAHAARRSSASSTWANSPLLQLKDVLDAYATRDVGSARESGRATPNSTPSKIPCSAISSPS